MGVIDAGNFKGVKEVDHLKSAVQKDLDRYVAFMNKNGCYAQGFSSIGTDVIEEIEKLAEKATEHFPGIVFFGGQLVFPQDTLMNHWLHNYTVFSIQRRFYQKGFLFMILPIRV